MLALFILSLHFQLHKGQHQEQCGLVLFRTRIPSRVHLGSYVRARPYESSSLLCGSTLTTLTVDLHYPDWHGRELTQHQKQLLLCLHCVSPNNSSSNQPSERSLQQLRSPLLSQPSHGGTPPIATPIAPSGTVSIVPSGKHRVSPTDF